jgi:hypothetical protein
VLSSSDSASDQQLVEKHLSSFPSESSPLVDSATSLGGQSVTPSFKSPFVPVGHISLDSDGADSVGKLSYGLKDIYRITNFYVSKALQGNGVGRQAMDALERMAVSKPLCAKTLALNTAANDFEGWEKSYHAVGVPLPEVSFKFYSVVNCRNWMLTALKHSIADWYRRRGYVEYKRVDSNGKEWPFMAVYLKKDIASANSK